MEPAVKTESRVEEVNQAENCKDQAKIRKFPDQLGVYDRTSYEDGIRNMMRLMVVRVKKKFAPVSKYWGWPAQQPMILLT